MTIEPDFGPALRDQPHLREQAIALLAARQHGVVASWQLKPLGFDKRAIHRRVRAGRLHCVHRGVYAVGHARITGNGRWMAAALAHGPLAVLSHRTAAAVYGLLRSQSPTAHVTVVARGRRSRSGIILHQVDVLDPMERAEVDGMPVTSIARTLLDLAADRDPLLERAIEESERLRLFDLTAIDAVATPGRPGVRRLRQALAIYRPGPGWTRSEFERRFLTELRRAKLPLPAVNTWIDHYEVDCVWWEQGLIVELDGGDYHDTTAARERDPVRDAHLQLKGFSILRISDRRLDQEPAAVMNLIRDFLSRAARTPARPGR